MSDNAYQSALLKIEKEIERPSGFLDLSNMQLVELPEKISEIRGLIVLRVCNNKISSLPKGIGNLTSLIHLDLSDNKLVVLPEGIKNLSKLNELYVNNNRLTALPGGIGDLSALKSLKISNNNLSAIPHEIGGLKNLNHLNLSDNLLESLPESIGDLENLKKVNLQNNKISYLPDSVKGWSNLEELILTNNKLEVLPDVFYNLSKLVRIRLEKNLFYFYPKPLLKSTSLTRKNTGNTNTENYYYYYDSIVVGLGDNFISDVPLEVMHQGVDAVREHFRRTSEQGVDYLWEAKIVVVGAGGAGKTTLIKKLKNPKYRVPNLKDERTQGIIVTRYPFKIKVNGEMKSLKANVWDFGGQELYHTTHQLFLTQDTLYVLVNDNRKNDTDFYYWLNVVSLRAGDECPILMVFNAKENAIRQLSLNEDLFGYFRGLIHEPVELNFADTELYKFRYLRNKIHHWFTNLRALGKPLPARWVILRRSLEELPEEHISLNRFRKICKNHEILDEKQQNILLQTLHNLGVLLYFSNVFGLENLIVLRHQWCTDAVYKALDNKEVQDNQGKFGESHLHNIWEEKRYKNQRLHLLKIMQYFDLCYRVESAKEEYIAPQLLPLESNRDPSFPKNDVLQYRIEYQFMPSGILTHLIARLSRHIKSPYVWRQGVTFHWPDDDTIAEVIEQPFQRAISIRLHGTDRKRHLQDIRWALYEIQIVYKGLRYTEFTYCPCEECRHNAQATMYKIKDLEVFAQSAREVPCENGTLKWILASHVLEGIIETEDEALEKAKYHFSNGELQKALSYLKMIPEIQNEALALSASCIEYQRLCIRGTVSNKEKERAFNDLTDRIGKLIELFERNEY